MCFPRNSQTIPAPSSNAWPADVLAEHDPDDATGRGTDANIERWLDPDYCGFIRAPPWRLGRLLSASWEARMNRLLRNCS